MVSQRFYHFFLLFTAVCGLSISSRTQTFTSGNIKNNTDSTVPLDLTIDHGMNYSHDRDKTVRSDSENWFTELEDMTYTVVKAIPLFGTIYSFERAGIAYRSHQSEQLWISVANCLGGFVRDVLLIAQVTEPLEIAILHTMEDSLTEKLIEIYHADPKVPYSIRYDGTLDQNREHLLVAESTPGSSASQLFAGKAKGVHYFHRSVFTGLIRHPEYAPSGERIQLYLPQGLFDGAKVVFSWKWTTDAWDTEDRAEVTVGYVRLEAGTPVRFSLSRRKGSGGWAGYDFKGHIVSANRIDVTTQIDYEDINIRLERPVENGS
ncbi:uncharacterized protein BBA_01712 [Beauveria bassiana ARSEF 2860]|uniref:Uncharacterized protein n=1 Tax=Beauveria bassiana (strain ARSEF 2860) TaxID=655819 RepID=J4UUR7_BEAB2|nr:uncharacterized protein BBA_01712 [Beauveria bassiana ARSEF 2860]EJP69747.1 hypothetical protein BBA_01712 [Beauveria bassiana ARSEF 2860]